jgi:hypothetical protein
MYYHQSKSSCVDHIPVRDTWEENCIIRWVMGTCCKACVILEDVPLQGKCWFFQFSINTCNATTVKSASSKTYPSIMDVSHVYVHMARKESANQVSPPRYLCRYFLSLCNPIIPVYHVIPPSSSSLESIEVGLSFASDR